MNPPAGWADAHNHLHLCAAADRAGYPCVVNATREDDWPDALAAAATATASFAALGIHPWHADAVVDGWLPRLRAMLETDATISIGECGLDSKTDRCPLDAQIPVFREQLRLAVEMNRPVTIHCVGAWGELVGALEAQAVPPRALIHSFNGSVEMAARLAGLGACFSISGRALQPSGAKAIRAFQTLAAERILLETDAPNAPGNLAEIGTEVAARLGFSPPAFAALTHRNFLRLFQP